MGIMIKNQYFSIKHRFLFYILGIIPLLTGTQPVNTAEGVQIPIIYRPEYNISFGPLDYLHPFDGSKYGRVFKRITPYIHPSFMYTAEPVTDEQLRLIHTDAYLNSLKSSTVIARIIEIYVLKILPNSLLQRLILKPMRYATGGTILGAQLALKHGKAINLGGGYHHAKPTKGEGFCVYADIPIAIKILWKENPNLKVMVVDLDAHQGNGVAESLKDELVKPNARVAIFDMYNCLRYPGPLDGTREYITYNNPVSEGVTEETYTSILESQLPAALDDFKPDLIIYNAGTDILAGDKIGGMLVSPQGIVHRDQFVFKQAQLKQIPILMVLSGGYTKQSADVIATSIINVTNLYK